MKTSTLGDVAEVFNGKTPSKAEKRSQGLPILKIRDVDERSLFKGSFDSFVDHDFHNKFSNKVIVEGDTLILNAAHNSAYVGSKQFKACEQVNGVIATGEWLIVRANKNFANKSYVNHWLRSKNAKHQIRNIVKGIHLYPKDVARLKIPLPPLDEQKRIAAILDKADAIRRKREKAIELTETLLRSVFLDMFGDPVTNPKGWDKKKVSEVAQIQIGHPFTSKDFKVDGIRLCRGANTLPSRLDWSDVRYWSLDEKEKYNDYLLKIDDIILALDRPMISGGLKIARVQENDLPALLVQRVARIRGQTFAHSQYLYYALSHPSFWNYCCPTETLVPHISPNELKAFPVACPNQNLIEKFGNAAFILSKVGKLKCSSHVNTSQLLASLTQRAFRGQLTSSDLNTIKVAE